MEYAKWQMANKQTHTTQHTHNPHAYICKSVGTLLLFVANMLHTCRRPRAEFDRFLLPLRQHLANLSLPISLSLSPSLSTCTLGSKCFGLFHFHVICILHKTLSAFVDIVAVTVVVAAVVELIAISFGAFTFPFYFFVGLLPGESD